MTKKDEVKEVLKTYLHDSLVMCNPERVMDYLAEDVIGFGMGEQGFFSSKNEIRNILKASMKNEPDARYNLDYQTIEVTFQASDIANVCATVVITRTLGDHVSQSGLMQTLGLRLTSGKWLITLLHSSPILMTEESIDAYPLKYAENSLAQLRSDLQREAFYLINRSISGGILACYRRNNMYPLYFVNDGMLSYLNYSRNLFVRRFGDNILNVVHPGDRRAIVEGIRDSTSRGVDFEMRHRMVKMNGEICWMLTRGRAGVDEHGDEVLIGVLVDITEMVRMQQQLEQQAMELEQQAKELRVSEERFRIALKKSNNIIFEYDIDSGNIIHSNVPRQPKDYVTHISDAKNTLAFGGAIEDKSLGGLHRIFEEIRGGSPQAQCIVKVLHPDGAIMWNQISLTGITDDMGHPVRAVGMIEDITRQKEAELAFASEEQYRQAILAHAMASYIIDFTKDIFESCNVNSPHCDHVLPGTPYEASIREAMKSRLSEEDRVLYLENFSRVHVLQQFEEGRREFTLEYQARTPDGLHMWMNTTLHLIRDIASGNLKGFMYVTDIDKKKRKELELLRKSERDPMTGVYNKEAAFYRIEDQLKSYEGMQSGVFMMIDVDYFKKINDCYGHPFGDRILISVSRILTERFRETDIVSRLGGDEFCAFFCGVTSVKLIEDTARSICENVKAIFSPLPDMPGVSCSIGISMCAGTSKTFSQLYSEADQALYLAKQCGKNGYAFYRFATKTT